MKDRYIQVLRLFFFLNMFDPLPDSWNRSILVDYVLLWARFFALVTLLLLIFIILHAFFHGSHEDGNMLIVVFFLYVHALLFRVLTLR